MTGLEQWSEHDTIIVKNDPEPLLLHPLLLDAPTVVFLLFRQWKMENHFKTLNNRILETFEIGGKLKKVNNRGRFNIRPRPLFSVFLQMDFFFDEDRFARTQDFRIEEMI